MTTSWPKWFYPIIGSLAHSVLILKLYRLEIFWTEMFFPSIYFWPLKFSSNSYSSEHKSITTNSWVFAFWALLISFKRLKSSICLLSWWNCWNFLETAEESTKLETNITVQNSLMRVFLRILSRLKSRVSRKHSHITVHFFWKQNYYKNPPVKCE